VTELLYLRDAYLRSFTATVVDRRDSAVALDRSAFYPTGGGQPHDTGTLGGLPVTDVRKEGDTVWHALEGEAPAVAATVDGEIDWARRHALMRTHTALHVLCGVILDIVGLDKQAGGGTHVRSTDEVGRVRVVKTENKGKGFKRVRLEVVDA
jgi:Ser-tRNA(Ala) deacylase AlaX